MRKQLLVSFLCCLLASATSLAQNWKSYEKIAKGKTYETSDCNLPGKARLPYVK